MKRWFWFIMAVSLVMRVWFVSVSEHTFYADEVFQSLEQGFRINRGFGLLNWEFVDGVRHPLVPLFVGGVLWLFDLLGWGSPDVYVWGLRLVFVVVSMSMVWCGYVLGRRVFRDERMGLWVMAWWGLGWEWVYFAGRPFYEFVAAYMVLAGLAGLFVWGRRWQSLAGFLVGYAVMIRPQYAFVIPVVWLVFVAVRDSLSWRTFVSSLKNGKWRSWVIESKVFGVGVLGAFLLGGLLEWWFWGRPWGALLGYVLPNLGRGYDLVDDVQSVWVEPIWFYVQVWLLMSGGLAVFALRGFRKYWFVWGLILCVLVPHSLVGHKEIRFVFLAGALVWMLAVFGFDDWFKEKSWSVSRRNLMLGGFLVVWSVLGWRRGLPMQEELFQLPLGSRYTQHVLYMELGRDARVCGVFDASQPWMVSGGYFYLGKNVPLYHANFVPERLAYVNVILSYAMENELEGFVLEKRVGGVGLYFRDGECVADEGYVYEREIL